MPLTASHIAIDAIDSRIAKKVLQWKMRDNANVIACFSVSLN